MARTEHQQPSPEELEQGVCLPSLKDERFCLLIVRGTPPCEASKIAYPENKNHSRENVKERLSRRHISQRIEFLRNEIAMRTTISLAAKRDLLAKMSLGDVPTEIIELPGGKRIRKFQPLAAIKYDSKLSGEEAAKKIDVMGTGLKLSFVLPSRDGSIQTIENTESLSPALPDTFLDVEASKATLPEDTVSSGSVHEPSLASTEDHPIASKYEISLLKNLEHGTSLDYEDEDEDEEDND